MDRRLSFLGLASVTTKNMECRSLSIRLTGFFMSEMNKKTNSISFFVHGTEAVHGDLGMVAKDDVVILISNSGETAEILATLPSLKKMGNYLISFTRSHHSSLAISCDLSVEIPVKSEADNLGLAPSCSSTVVLVVGDAVALALSELKKFTRADFGLYHPGGALGIKANS